MSECKIMITNWLNAKKRTNDDIANKILEAMDLTYSEVIKYHNLELKKELFRVLTHRPEISKLKWHHLW